MAKQEIEEFVKSRPPLFWWLLANILAIAFAITSWVICLNLFRDPTNAKSYQLMIKVGRLPQRPSPVGRLILRNWKRNSSALKMKTSRLSTTSYFGLTSLIMTNRSSSLT
jgi:hypothetical protein